MRPPSALRVAHRAGLLWPVAGAARISRLQVRDVPQGTGRRAHRGGSLLPGGPVRGVPGPRHRRNYPHLPHHPPIIGEVWMLGYLLVIGVKTVRPDERNLTAE